MDDQINDFTYLLYSLYVIALAVVLLDVFYWRAV